MSKKHRHSKKLCICKSTYNWWTSKGISSPAYFEKMRDAIQKVVKQGLDDEIIIDYSCKCKKDKYGK